MKLAIETHKFAPELNKVLFIRNQRVIASLRAPNVTTVRQARETLLKPQQFVRVATVSTVYPEKWKELNRTYKGRIRSYAELIDFKRMIEGRTCLGELLSGEVLPAANITVKIDFRG